MPTLTEYLKENNGVTDEQLAAASEGFTADDQIAQRLVDLGSISNIELAQAIAARGNLPFVRTKDYPVNRTTISLVPAEMCRQNLLVPLEQKGNELTIALSDPANVTAVDDVRAFTKMVVRPVVGVKDEILATINLYLRSDAELQSLSNEIELGHRTDNSAEPDVAVQQNAPIVRFVNLLITQAIQDRASDIHIEPCENYLRVRYRIDGVLHEIQREPSSIQAEILSRIKVMSDMDISERRLPQDGRMTFSAGAETRDLRVASLPTVWGEKLVLRILDSRTTNMSFQELGLEPANLKTFEASVKRPWGMTLVTGPTGSGKTTTLYASLAVVAGADVNVITVEDPIEYRMDGINQVQVNAKANLTFATALRSILRADPNILMVGEIRDRETAQIAIEAALTGHLVLSTLHTNDAPSAVTRLLELGIEPFLIASSLECVMAQRLARKLCEECKEAYHPDQEHLKQAGFNVTAKDLQGKFFKPVGCARCSHTGYRGRLAIQEVMPVTEGLEQLILNRETSTDIKAFAVSEGMVSLRDDGFIKIKAGLTSIEEVLRVVA